MKVFIAGLATETNSFSPIPTGDLAFKDSFVSRQATQEPANLFSAPMHEWREMAEARGWNVIESLSAFAQPAGTTIRKTYEAFRDEILDDMRKAAPDIVLLSMHGAMIADGYDDCEGDLLQKARAIVGPDVTIGLEIDPHNHLTRAMFDATDVIVSYKEYPHTDSPDRARDLFALVADTAEGKIHPVGHVYDCRMISMYHTTREPMRSFVDDMMAREGAGGVLSLSLSHGFPWGDCADVGTRMLAYADGDAGLAEKVAVEFGQRLWGLRDQFLPDWPSIGAALDRAAKGDGPVVVADFADNAGGGAPADSTFVLQEVLNKGLRDVALGIFFDPVLVRMCQDAGQGATMRVRLGGKIGAMSGDPVDLDVVVREVREGMHQFMGETRMEMGTGVWLEADGVHMVVNDKRTQAFHPICFTDLGIDLGAMQIVVVKSSQHFHAGFAPIASEVIYISGPGAITPDYANIPYTKRDGNYWPRVEDPFKD